MKKITHTLILCMITVSLSFGQAFITTWKTDNPGTSNDDQITIPTNGTGYNYDIDWGDGSNDTGVSGNITHTYSSAGTYTVSISGDFPAISFNNGGDKQKILTVEQWGNIEWTSMFRAFYGCTNLNVVAADAPDLSNVTSLYGTFRDCTNFNGEIGNWDISNITSLVNTFLNASSFNQDIGSWNTSNVVNMQSTFGGAISFNKNIGNWNTANVTSMNSMFYNAQDFNQDIGNWNTSQVINMNGMFFNAFDFNKDISGWVTNNVTDMALMFYRALSFNQDISNWNTSAVTNMRTMFFAAPFNQDLSNWDVSNVTQMDYMFNQSAFDQDISSWDVSSVTIMTDMFSDSDLSSENYDKILNSWSQLTLQNNVIFGALGISYCEGSDARQSIIDNFNWTISDEGEFCIVNIPDANFKAALLVNASINTTDDGEISYTEAEAFTGTINISNLSITDLTGIEAFINITALFANNNNIGSIDISHNTKLQNLQVENCGLNSGIDISALTELTAFNARSNDLNTIDLSNNSKLSDLRLEFNDLSSIDLSANTMITQLRVANNPLTILDLSAQSNLTTLYADNTQINELDVSGNSSLHTLSMINGSLTSLNVANGNNSSFVSFTVRFHPDLSCITVDDVAFSEANWADPNNSAGFSTDCNVVNIPDDNFRNALLSNASINTNDDEFIQIAEAYAYTGSIEVRSLSITDLTGIEAFTNIDFLDCYGNELTSLDLTGNTSLTAVNCRSNQLTSIDITGITTLQEFDFANNVMTSIDVSTNTGLTYLGFNGNQLTTVDVSNNINLQDIGGYDNLLTSIDVSNNPLLAYLEIYDNELTEVDISNNPLLVGLAFDNNQLTSLNIANGNNSNFEFFSATGNANLTCITVDDVAYAEANFTDIDEVANFSTNCNNTSNDIISFSFIEQTIDAIIDVVNHTIVIDVVSGSDFSNLTPTFTVSAGATADPASGIAQDFSSSFVYTITAENPTAIQEWTVTVREENFTPTDITLSNNSIDENNSSNDVIGSFSTTDPNTSDLHTYTLVAGSGDTDNASFDISGSDLIALEPFDFETKSSYSIRVQTFDGRDGTFEKEFTITVNDVIEQVAQTITFNAIEDQFLEAGSVNLTASASSGLDVSFSVVSGPATVSGNVVSFSDLGTVVIQADQAGDSDFFAANPVQQSFEVITVTGFEDEASALLVYPNPASNMITVQTQQENISLKLLNNQGAEIMEVRPNVSNDISRLDNGIYFLRISNVHGVTTHKIIKK